MAKYVLKALSVQIGGIVYHKSDNDVFNTEGKHKGLAGEIEAAEKAGFLEELKDEKKSAKKGKFDDVENTENPE
jgi:hypothetical protein